LISECGLQLDLDQANPGQTAHRLVKGQGIGYSKMTEWRSSETLQIEISPTTAKNGDGLLVDFPHNLLDSTASLWGLFNGNAMNSMERNGNVFG